MRAGERWAQAHRTHTYQRWCDVGWTHQEVTLLTAATTILVTLLAAASLTGNLALRAGGDLAALALLVLYLASPALLGHPGLSPGRDPAPGQSRARRPSRARLTGSANCRGSRAEVRILIVTHYFPPETGAPQARLSALAATWAADGDQVTVLTGMPNHPTGVLPPQYRRAVRRRERRDGYRILRTWLYATPNEGIARKTLGHLSFMASSVLLGALGQRARRRGGGLLADLLLHRLRLAAGPAEAGPAGRGDPRPVARHLHRARRADQPPGHRACSNAWNSPPTRPRTRSSWSARDSGTT